MRFGIFGLLAAAMVALSSVTALAQGTQVPFGALRVDPSAQVEVTADRLSVDQSDGTAIFSGNVLVIQGEMRLSAAEVRVIYGQPAEGAPQRVDRLEASGGVTLTAGAEAAESRDAVYTVDSGQIVMTGDVVVTQGPNALSSQRLTVNLETGTGLLEGGVRTILKTGTTP